MRTFITLERAGPHDDAILETSYDPDLVAIVKTIPAQFRTWNSQTRCWAIHPTYCHSLAIQLRRVGFTVIDTSEVA
jgi:hypothetical protein